MNEPDEEKLVMIKVVLPDNLRHEFKTTCVSNKSNMNTILIDYIKKYVAENIKSRA
jgi:hypothetical protein